MRRGRGGGCCFLCRRRRRGRRGCGMEMVERGDGGFVCPPCSLVLGGYLWLLRFVVVIFSCVFPSRRLSAYIRRPTPDSRLFKIPSNPRLSFNRYSKALPQKELDPLAKTKPAKSSSSSLEKAPSALSSSFPSLVLFLTHTQTSPETKSKPISQTCVIRQSVRPSTYPNRRRR